MLKDNLKLLNTIIDEERQIVIRMLQHIKNVINSNDLLLIEKITKTEELALNTLEIDGTQLCITTLALYQPEAKFLRIVVTGLQLVHALERVGDMAVNIADRLAPLIEMPEFPSKEDLFDMIAQTIDMLDISIDSFLRGDVTLVKSIFEKDDSVDTLRDKIINDAIIKTSQARTSLTIMLVNIAQNLERIADITITISKNVIYMTTGEIIEHTL